MERVNAFAAAIDITAAGMRAATPRPANAIPADHGGNSSWNICGTTVLRSPPFGRTPSATAKKPSIAMRPSARQ